MAAAPGTEAQWQESQKSSKKGPGTRRPGGSGFIKRQNGRRARSGQIRSDQITVWYSIRIRFTAGAQAAFNVDYTTHRSKAGRAVDEVCS
ncbi:hypothetical protein J1614_006681 [Plenodomus biglobosus]|nr:hypothetical protein J1614_006681 [Plenodomus biglobosus]